MNSTTGGQTKEGKTAGRVQRAQAPVRRTALVSARRRDCARQRPNKFTILFNSQKHITCLDVHCNACWKHFNSSTDQNQKTERDEDLLFVCLLSPLLCQTRRNGHRPRGSRMQQRTHINITGPLISTQELYDVHELLDARSLFRHFFLVKASGFRVTEFSRFLPLLQPSTSQNKPRYAS